MEEAAIIEQLILFGLSRQEAVIYLCLLQNEELTGYEVAKLTGISRSNVYNGLASLVEHGAAYVIEGTSSKYLAVALSEFCDNRIRYLRKAKERLVTDGPRKNLPEKAISPSKAMTTSVTRSGTCFWVPRSVFIFPQQVNSWSNGRRRSGSWSGHRKKWC